MRIRIVLAVGLALTAIATLVVLLRSPLTVASTNGIQPTAVLSTAAKGTTICQAGETLPAGTTAIRLELQAVVGPPVDVEIFSARRVIARGARGSGWFGASVTVGLKPLRRTLSGLRVCARVSSLSGYIESLGANTRPAIAATANGKRLPGRLGIAYLRPGRESWLAQARTVMRHMGLGRAASGTGIVFPIAMLMAAAIACGCWLTLRELE